MYKKIIITIVAIATIPASLLGAEDIASDDIQFSARGEQSIPSVRQILGRFDPLKHTTTQLRMGYISLQEDGAQTTSGYALGGHIHIDTKRWNGFMVGGSLYSVLDLGINQNSLALNPDFFDADNKSFMVISEAFIQGKWGKREFKVGRQILDTPHLDSDDIRMMPNYFTAYTAQDSTMDGLVLFGGVVTQMAGWENGIDSAKFVDIDEVLELPQSTNGIYYLSALYEGIEDISASLWYYNYHKVANIWYAEIVYSHQFENKNSLSLGIQYDKATNSNDASMADQDSNTFGINAEVKLNDLGITMLAAYNKDSSETGASGLSLGGGPFFTSMEDQTLDAIEYSASAWMLGCGYYLEKIGIDGAIFGVAYGHFEAEDASIYESSELDIVLEYTLDKKLSITAAYAKIDHQEEGAQDYNNFRVIAKYNL